RGALTGARGAGATPCPACGAPPPAPTPPRVPRSSAAPAVWVPSVHELDQRQPALDALSHDRRQVRGGVAAPDERADPCDPRRIDDVLARPAVPEPLDALARLEALVEAHGDGGDGRRARGVEGLGREVVVEQEGAEAPRVGLADPAGLIHVVVEEAETAPEIGALEVELRPIALVVADRRVLVDALAEVRVDGVELGIRARLAEEPSGLPLGDPALHNHARREEPRPRVEPEA